MACPSMNMTRPVRIEFECVRRAFLGGEDRHTGRSYTHRKQWIVDKIKALSAVFAIDVCAYAVMYSHYHVVLFVDEERALEWVDADKRGFIPEEVPPILTRLGVEADTWIETVRHFRHHFYAFVGPADALMRYSQALGRNWLRGVGACRKLLGGGGLRKYQLVCDDHLYESRRSHSLQLSNYSSAN
jgi:hypothetical protein